MLIACIGTGTTSAAETPSFSAPQDSAASAVVPKDLADLLVRAETAEKLRQAVYGQRAAAASALRWEQVIEEAEQAFQSLFATLRLEHTALAEAAIRDLYDVDSLASKYESQIAEANLVLRKQASNLDDSLQRLDAETLRWDPWLAFAEQREAPPEILYRGAEVKRQLEQAKIALRPLRDQLLLLFDRALRLHARVEALHSELALRRSALREQLGTVAAEPLWINPDSHLKQRDAEAGAALDSWRNSFRIYWKEYGWQVSGLFMLVFAAFLVLLRRARRSVAEAATTDAKAVNVQLIFSHPLWPSLLMALLAVAWLAPRGPVAFYDLVFFCMPIPAVIAARALRGPGIQASLYSLALALLFQPFHTVLDLMPELDRRVLIGQVVLVGGILLFDLYRGRFQRAFSKIPPAALILVVGMIGCGLVAAGMANIAGLVGVSKILRDGLLGLLGFGMVYSLAVKTLYGLTVALIRTRFAGRSRILAEYPEETLRIAYHLLTVTGTLMFVVSTSFSFHVADDVLGVFSPSLDARLGVGEGRISIGSLLTAAAIGFGTYYLIKALRLILEVEIFPRLYLPLGVPFAISAITCYAVAFVGFLMVTSALGIDLTKVTVLAGALGVGIGFGLQNIFNNFVSGLILLFERPVHVEDVIEVGNLLGVIKRIGIRSSTVRTVQGAEVIVPNADLISQEVINWTLSDRKRRLEIDVGVAYGTDVERVIGLLEAVARESKDTLSDPKPFAIFRGFGDSSLDFRLHAWIERFEDNLWIGSDLRRAILARFSENRIEIPFPQRDLNIRSNAAMVPESAQAADRTGRSNPASPLLRTPEKSIEAPARPAHDEAAPG